MWQHTPSPWTGRERSGRYIAHLTISGRDGEILTLASFGAALPQWQANKALVLAAPDLLDMLRMIDEWLNKTDAIKPNHDISAIISSVKAAIALAKP